MATPPLNPPSFRRPFTLPDDTPEEVKKAIETTYEGLLVHEQAFKAIKTQIDTANTTATAAAEAASSTPISAGVTSFNTLAGNVTYFPNLGDVNNQTGTTAYTTQQSDNGAKIIVADASPIAITLNASVGTPWFTVIDNDSTAVATLTPSSGTLNGETTIPGYGFGLVFFDGVNWWCGAVKLATCSLFGYVRPDCVSIGFDSSTGSIRTIGIDSSIITAKRTGGGTEGLMVFSKGLLVSSVQAT